MFSENVECAIPNEAPSMTEAVADKVSGMPIDAKKIMIPDWDKPYIPLDRLEGIIDSTNPMS